MRPSVKSSCLLIICLITMGLFGALLVSVQKNNATAPALPLTQVSQPVTVTPPPLITPTSEYHVEYFHITTKSVSSGDCLVLAYWVVGASSLTLTSSLSPETPILITDNPNTRTVCPSEDTHYVEGVPTVYTLDIVYLDGRTETRSVTAP